MNFAKTFWAALLAFVVANIVLAIIGVMMLAGFVAALGSFSATKVAVVAPRSVLKIDLSELVEDAHAASPLHGFDFMSMKMKKSHKLIDVLDAIDRAAYDDRIKGIYLTGGICNVSSPEELRSAILKFKESDKFVVAYNEVSSKYNYWMCSVADRVLLNPEGMIEWMGLSSSVMFFKGTLEKLGAEVDILRHGSFKSAVEPFYLDGMSRESRLQMDALLGSMWGKMVGDVARSRGLDSADLIDYADRLSIYSAEKAVELGLADSLVYQDQVNSLLSEMSGGQADGKPEIVSMHNFISARQSPGRISKNKVALIYINGQIMDGESGDGYVGGATIAAKLEKVRKDAKVKSVVVRVNSPGGSALASEVMLREMALLRAEKPVVVSMGDMAASGGYYVACQADAILANQTTITGSIGVFGVMLNAKKGLRDKLGVTVDVSKTNPSADLGLGMFYRSLTDPEREFMMRQIEKVYSTFVGHVAAGRNLTVAEVDAIGQGRVWSGVDALSIGLIDGFGGLMDAIHLAADRAGIADDYRIYQVTDAEDQWTMLLRTLSEMEEMKMRSQLGDLFTQYKQVDNLLKIRGVQALMPYSIEIN